MPLRLFLLPRKMRGAERRQALVRNAAPGGPSRGRTHLRIAGDDRPMTRAGAPLGALLRLWRMHLCIRPAPVRACVPRDEPGRQRAPRTGAVVPPGRVPKPPGCRLRAGRAGAAPAGLRIAACPPPDLDAHLHARLRPAPPSRRLSSGAPQRAGCEQDKCGFSEGDNFFSGSYPRQRR